MILLAIYLLVLCAWFVFFVAKGDDYVPFAVAGLMWPIALPLLVLFWIGTKLRKEP